MTNPSRIAFTLFGRDIYWYGVLIAAAVFIGIMIGYRRVKRYGIKQDDFVDFAILAIPLAVVVARLYYVVFEWDMFKGDLLKILRLWEGGLAIYGAVIGGVVAAVIFCKRRKISFWALADAATPALVLGQAIGRWGNFFNQEAFGIQVTNPAHMWFPLAVKIDATDTVHYATFFYESLWCFLIFAFIMLMSKRFKHRGDCFLWYLTLYPLERALVEGLRTDSLYIGTVRVSQLLSVLLFLGGVGYMVWRHFKEKRTGVLVGAPPYFAIAPEEAELPPSDEAAEEPTGESITGEAIQETIVAAPQNGQDERVKAEREEPDQREPQE